MAPTLHIQLLGDFRLMYGNAPLTTIHTARLQSLLAYLLLHRHAPQSRQHVAFALWPDSTEAHAHGSLRKLLHQFSSALPKAETFLRVDRQNLQWQLDAPFSCDVAEFEQTARDSTNADSLRRAADLYRGDLLSSCYDDWIIPERERVRQLFTVVLERLLVLLEQQREYREAIQYAQRLLQHDPLHEETYRQLMRLYTLSDDRAGALRVYHACATALERELGVEPSSAVRQEYERLLNADAGTFATAAPATPLVASLPLVGRDQEWAQLLRAWRPAAAGQPHFVLLSGAAGIGKTRLAEQLLDWARRQGIATASARAYAAEGALAYAPIVSWLRTRPLATLAPHWRSEIARLLPELLTEEPELVPPGPLTEAWQRQHFFEAISRALLAGPQPLLLVIDDLQWCDRDTLEWLHYLLRFDPHARLLIVGTVRSEGMSENHPLTGLSLALRRSEQLTEIELGALNQVETTTLAQHIIGRQLTAASAARLFRETEGNSLFVVEMSRAEMLETAASKADGGTVRLSPTIQAVMRAHLAQLSPFAHELARVAATIGREFTFDVLRQASDEREDALVRGLDELWQKRIVREQAPAGYDFTHDKLREVAYVELGPARRRMLHRRVAQALEAVHANNLDAVSRQTAAHYDLGGLPGHAIPFYRRAAETARRVYANQDAIALYQRGLALLEHVSGVDASGTTETLEEAVQIHAGLGDVLEHLARHDEARASYRQALENLPPQDLLKSARLYRKLGNTFKSQGCYAEALPAYNLAEKALAAGLAEPAAPWSDEWIDLQFDRFALQYGRADIDEMVHLAEKVKPRVELHGTVFQRAHLYLLFNQINFRRDRYLISDETLANARAVIAAFQDAGDPNHLNANLFQLGFVLLWRGLLAEAEEQLLRALAWDEQIGEIYEKTLVLTYLATLYRKRGRVDQARQYALLALENATNANITPYIGTARANLAWVAWKKGRPDEAQVEAQAAVGLWETAYPFQYPFQWTALLPLIDISVKRKRTAEALQYDRKLIEPHQQLLPEALATPLQEAIQFWERGESKSAARELARAIQVGQDLGYL